MGYQISTRCLYGDKKNNENGTCDKSGALSFPIYQSATFAHGGVGESTGYDYSRLQNPTREQLELVVASLEKGCDALAFSSGMAAITVMMELFAPGDHIIADVDLYGGTTRLFNNISKKNGITITSMDCSVNSIEEHITEQTKAVYIETPTNPMMHIIDIEKLAAICGQHNLLLMVDNTFLSPYFQNPLELGADIVVHSGTKYLGGHNDTIAGFLVTSKPEIAERFRFIIKTTGSGLAPFDSWLILRGIKTLAVRMEQAQKNAQQIVEFLLHQEQVKKVYYPGIPGTEGYEICKRQARGFGSMITFEVESKELALHILEHVELIHFAESLGGVETLITYPVTQTHADVAKDVLEAGGITECILRLSIGIEDSQDLLAELTRVFQKK